MIKKPCIKKILLSIGLLAVVSLVGYDLHDIIFGSKFSVDSIKNGQTISDTYLPIKGYAPRAKEVSVNGHSVGIDRNGSFSDGILLSRGYNIVEVTLTDRFGRQKNKIYQLAQVGDGGAVAIAVSN